MLQLPEKLLENGRMAALVVRLGVCVIGVCAERERDRERKRQRWIRSIRFRGRQMAKPGCSFCFFWVVIGFNYQQNLDTHIQTQFLYVFEIPKQQTTCTQTKKTAHTQ